MTIVLRYVFLRFLGLFLLCLLSTIAVFLIIDGVGNSKIWLSRDPDDMYVYYLNYVPHITYLIFPVALLLASVFSVGGLAKHLELVALRSAGISAARVLSPLVLFGLLGSAAMFILSDTILPRANHTRFQINEPKTPEEESGDPLEKFDYVYTSSDRDIYYFDYYSGRRQAGQGVTVLMHHAGRLIRRIDARSLEWKGGWKLRDGTIRTFIEGGLRARRFEEYPLETFRDRPGDLLDTRVHPDEMALEEMERRIAIQKRTGEPTSYLETQWHFRFSAVMVNFFMVMLGVSMAANTIKTGLARNFGIALLITFLYYVALRLGLIMGENGSLPPAVGAWMGNMLFGPLGLLLFWRMVRS